MKNLRSLNLGYNKYNLIINSGIRNLINGISNLQNLEILDLAFLQENKITDQDISYFGSHISKLRNLKELSLLLGWIPHSKDQQESGITGLNNIKKLQKLKKLSLRIQEGQKMNKNDFEIVGECFKDLENLKKLEYRLEMKNISEQESFYLTKNFQTIPQLAHLQLKVSGNKLNENSYTNLISNLGYLQRLERLEFVVLNAKNSKMTTENIIRLSGFLEQNQNIKQLELYIWFINDPQQKGIERLGIIIGNLAKLEKWTISGAFSDFLNKSIKKYKNSIKQ